MQLHEQFRPYQWSEVVGQDKAIAILDRIRKRGLSGRTYFVTGAYGTGKTTIARLIAAEVADPHATDEIDGSEVTAAVLDDLRHQRQSRPFGKGYCLIIDECHILRDATVTKLLKLTEGLPPWVTVIFCTSAEGVEALHDKDDFGALLSRCTKLPLARRDLTKPFAIRLVAGAREAGLLNGHVDTYYVARAERLCKEQRNNLRACWQAVEAGYLTASEADASEVSV